MPSTLLPSLIRTGVPLLVGWLLSLPVVPAILGALGAGDSQEQRRLLAQAVTLLITFAYYAAVRLLEKYVSPKFGWALGLASEPVYVDSNADGAYDVSTLPTESQGLTH